MMFRFLMIFVLVSAPSIASQPDASDAAAQPIALRVATFNLGDVRGDDLATPDQPRLKRLAEVIQRIRPSILLLNEIACDGPGSPGYRDGGPVGTNAQRFVDLYLAVSQAPGLKPLRFNTFMGKTNTGMHSGFDLNRDGRVVNTFPPPQGANAAGEPGAATADARAYGDDAWGFGTFPGQYGMALLIDPRLEIVRDDIRTFRLMPWDFMPNNLMPTVPGEEDADGNPTPWYAGAARERFRLSSKSHWDVPIKLPNGEVVHMLCSHPTPPAFDGDEQRNRRRNHDEIRFWADYVINAPYIVDDTNQAGGLDAGSHFVILGDLNADPADGSSLYNPIGRLLFASDRLAPDHAPSSEIEIEGLDATDTAMFRLRVDYVLPSADIGVRQSGVWRLLPSGSETFPSDHFPVWADLVIPKP